METEELKNLLECINERLERIANTSLISMKDILTVEEVIIYTGYSREHIYKLVNGGELPSYKCGKRRYIKKTDLNDWILKEERKEEIERKAVKYCRTNKVRMYARS